jgi:hypothetical protein
MGEDGGGRGGRGEEDGREGGVGAGNGVSKEEDGQTQGSVFFTPRSYLDSDEDWTAASRTPPYLTWSEISDDDDDPRLL